MLVFMGLSWRCSTAWVFDVGTEIRINGLEVVAEPDYELCLAAVLALSVFMLQALVRT